ncbi:MAG: DUF6653 family protein [Candidatus Fervidibacter sacchari]
MGEKFTRYTNLRAKVIEVMAFVPASQKKIRRLTTVVEKLTSKLFRLDDEGWMRHANPWSGLTRVPCLALLVAAFWSRVWLGWYSAIPIAAILLWTHFNPRCFGEQCTFKACSSPTKATGWEGSVRKVPALTADPNIGDGLVRR